MPTPWSHAFDVEPGYLNTASIGVPPGPAVEAVDAALHRWRRGRLEAPEFDEHVWRARAAWARLSGVAESTVAIGASVSAFAGIIATSVPDGTRVLVAEGEFTSVVFPFLAQAHRDVRVREVPLDSVIESVDDTVDLVAVSAVQSADGRLVDVPALTAAAHRCGARVLLDVTQSSGWLPVDLHQVDYAVCAAYKWLLCPRGVAFLTGRPDALGALVPATAGWYAGESVWDSVYGAPLRLASDARRLDVSPAWFSWVGAAVALEYLAACDLDRVRRHDVGLADAFRVALGLPASDSAITVMDVPGAERALADAGVRTAVRAGRIRLSFHLYNDEADVALAIDALRPR